MKILLLITFIQILQLTMSNKSKSITKNGMTVKWEINENMINFEVSAPTKGWVAIGFNESEKITGAYLLMGRVNNVASEVIEHYTLRPGNYQPITNFGIPSQVKNVKGHESETSTFLNFTIPINKISNYHKNLNENSSWNMIIAFSAEDDFQHHSMMRTNVPIIL